MTMTVDAIYENGVLKPATPLPLKEHEQVTLTVEPYISWAERTAGILQWTGDAETFEASQRFGWSSKIVDRLKRQPALIQQLNNFRHAIEQVPRLGIQVLTISTPLVSAAAAASQQHGLLSNDALIVAVMQANGLAHLASHDADFDRVPGITRYSPV